jgi:hypothetical protein
MGTPHVSRLITTTVGLTSENKVVYRYLQSLAIMGMFTQSLVDLVIQSFEGEVLPVVTERHFKEVFEKGEQKYPAVYGAIAASRNQEALKFSLLFINGAIAKHGLQENENEIKRCHAGIVRFFL